MGRFVTDDWLLVDRPGIVGLNAFHDACAVVDTMTHEILRVRVLTPDVAILITHSRNTGTYAGHPISADEWTSDVFVRTPIGWRCITAARGSGHG